MATKVELDESQDWDAVAGLFRAGGDAIYPGVLLVCRADSYTFHPIDDFSFAPDRERIMGVSVWGSFSEFQLGCVAVEVAQTIRYAALVAGDVRRPDTGIARLDAWIARADALRRLRAGTPSSFGGIPLAPAQLRGAVGAIEGVVRESAVTLLRIAPESARSSFSAMAAVADSSLLNDAVLTSAIRALLVESSAWCALEDRRNEPQDLVTQAEAAREAKCDPKTVQRALQDGRLCGYGPNKDLVSLAAVTGGHFIRRRHR